MSSHVIESLLSDLHVRHASDDGGSLADYIPELEKADPSWFGMSLCTTGGTVYETGDADREFTIQSISKPFVYALALMDHGPGAVIERIGVEPSGNSFNSILLDRSDRPHNPMVNAGAIAAVGLISASGPRARFERILDLLGGFAGRELGVDERVFESERATGDRNRAIAHLMRNVGAIEGDVEALLDVYFRQCSVLVTSTDLAVMTATLANGGVNPITRRPVAPPELVGDVLSVMFTSGMYDYSGEWAFRTGLPAKSGVSGGVAALIPAQAGVGVFSPLVDDRGNSVRGTRVCEEFSQRLGFHVFRSRFEALPAIRSVSTGEHRRSVRVRTLDEERILRARARETTVVEAQGTWSFGSAEQLMRAIDGLAARHLVIETSRMTGVDETSAYLVQAVAESLRSDATAVVFAGRIPPALGKAVEQRFDSLDEALEWCEDRILGEHGAADAAGRTIDVAESDLGRDLDPAGASALAAVATKHFVDRGAVAISAGNRSRSMYLVTAGRLGAYVSGTRVASFAPGSIVGEMAFLTGDARSASIVAEEPSSLLEFGDLSGVPARVRETVYRNIAVVVSERLAAANRVLQTTS